jgi:hypothetical protein
MMARFQDSRLWPVECHVINGAEFAPLVGTDRSETNSSLEIWWVEYWQNREEAENVAEARMIYAESATVQCQAQIVQRGSKLLKKHLNFQLHKSTRKT